ncbi:anthranilate synthase component II [Spirosoma soli]|uniref:Anthranilate synthase component II n=1 Tax=Spirosoma soli TaxID=1770529 RepID=A0ABW5MAB9_9BACT
MNLLIVDNFDSFTYMLVDYLRQAGANCRVVRNNQSFGCFTEEPVDAVVLSPGPGTPQQAGHLMNVIDYYHQKVPMLGVCLGHQAIGEFFGATLSVAKRPMHGKVSTMQLIADDVLWDNVPEKFAVTRYHSLLLTDLPDALVSLAETDQKEVMALRHITLPIRGVQFHPEAALTENGLQIIKNWINSTVFIGNKADSSLLTAQYA